MRKEENAKLRKWQRESKTRKEIKKKKPKLKKNKWRKET